jgi:hypothetical protein
MTRTEVKNNLGAQIYRYDNTQEWRDAFLLYNAVHGTKLKPNCGKCFEKVKEWLLA